MKIVRSLLLAVIVAPSLVVLGATQAVACSCIPPRPDEQALKDAAAVFTGTLAAANVEEVGFSGATWTFDVDTVYKGNVSSSQEITSETQGPACGIVFKEEKRYAVFAYDDEGELHTNSCSNTRSIGADETLGLATGAAPPQAPAGEPDEGGTSNTFVIGSLALVGIAAILSVVALTRRRRTSD